MSKHHIQNIAEQLAHKGYATSPFHQEITRYQANEAMKSEEIQLRAYQIHIEKGGSDLDNWLEAEQSLKNNDKTASLNQERGENV